MRKSKILIRSLVIIYLCFGFLSGIGLCAEPDFCINASDSSGGWQKGMVTQRKVAFTDKAKIKSKAQIYVPNKGNYQLVAYVYHNWRKNCPCIYVEAIDSAGMSHAGYHKIENAWYLGPQDQGRWFFISLSDNPYWDLPEGIMGLTFWAEARDSAWGYISVPMENKVSIAQFFLIPVTGSNSKTFLSWFPDIGSGSGNWQICDYDHAYATNLIKTSEKNSLFCVNSTMPVTSYYVGLLSVLPESDGSLGVEIKNAASDKKSLIKLKANKEWNIVYMRPVKLNKGACSIYFKNLNQNKVMIDYFFLIPVGQSFDDTSPVTKIAG